jgi:hypothetical protein
VASLVYTRELGLLTADPAIVDAVAATVAADAAAG